MYLIGAVSCSIYRFGMLYASVSWSALISGGAPLIPERTNLPRCTTYRTDMEQLTAPTRHVSDRPDPVGGKFYIWTNGRACMGTRPPHVGNVPARVSTRVSGVFFCFHTVPLVAASFVDLFFSPPFASLGVVLPLTCCTAHAAVAPVFRCLASTGQRRGW